MRREAKRHGCHHAAPEVRPSQANAILTEYDHATRLGGIIIAVSFGLMFFVGVMLGW